jgi:hypothetical protein
MACLVATDQLEVVDWGTVTGPGAITGGFAALLTESAGGADTLKRVKRPVRGSILLALAAAAGACAGSRAAGGTGSVTRGVVGARASIGARASSREGGKLDVTYRRTVSGLLVGTLLTAGAAGTTSGRVAGGSATAGCADVTAGNI